MNLHDERLSYSSLVSRVQFYKEHTLNLERKLFQLEEIKEQLTKELNDTKQEKDDLYQQLEENRNVLENETSIDKEEMVKYKQTLEKTQLELDEKNSQLEVLQEQMVEKEETLLLLQKTVDDKNLQLESLQKEIKTLEQQLNVYEKELSEKNNLSDVPQQRLNELEQTLHMYESKVHEKNEHLQTLQQQNKDLERKLQLQISETDEKDKQIEALQQSLQNPSTSIEREIDNNLIKLLDVEENQYKSLAYFDYSFILFENNVGLIEGSFHIENTGFSPLEEPYICFRMTPIHASHIEGMTYFGKASDKPEDEIEWAPLTKEWTEEARERGEIWIGPGKHLIINQGQTVSIENFQITVNKGDIDILTIEGFVLFKNYKIKASNRIIIR